ncbi:MAG: protein kinase, partial [Planctomycetota bacterium]
MPHGKDDQPTPALRDPGRQTPRSLRPTKERWSVATDVGQFRLLRVLCERTDSTLYLARDNQSRQQVVLKCYWHRDRETLNRIKHAARKLREIAGPNLVRVHDVHQIKGRVVLSLQLIEGRDCAGMVQAWSKLPRDAFYQQMSKLLRQVATGLHALHRSALVYQDMKPANVVMNKHGDATVVDLDCIEPVSHLINRFASSTLDENRRSNPSSRLGTPDFMAPELLKTTGIPSEASDMYSLGLTVIDVICRTQRCRDAADDLPNEDDLSHGDSASKADVTATNTTSASTNAKDQISRHLAAKVGGMHREPHLPGESDRTIAVSATVQKDELLTGWKIGDNFLRGLPGDCPPELFDVLRRLVSLDDNARPNADEVMGFRLRGECPNQEMPCSVMQSEDLLNERAGTLGVFRDWFADVINLQGSAQALKNDHREFESLTGVFHVLADRGVGRTRLFRELRDKSFFRYAALLLSASCQGERGVDNSEIATIVDQLQSIRDSSGDRIEVWLGTATAQRLRKAFPATALPIRGSRKIVETSTSSGPETLVEDLVQLLRGVCERMPVCILLDDYQSADPMTKQLVQRLQQTGIAGLGVVLFSRTIRDGHARRRRAYIPRDADDIFVAADLTLGDFDRHDKRYRVSPSLALWSHGHTVSSNAPAR